ncbi:hypothetical protein BV25DRAFT_1912992 [Artomyces pyxidatus]|uniref:Uncharacterized protein n=1 Tax=Artomyces pyxidatus TaxID=48021 RepID=A0ACB8TDD2_9AGAM|nr:hypothetical protein BV25DRAFT_1912992 [Artomyces pyxidatus]
MALSRHVISSPEAYWSAALRPRLSQMDNWKHNSDDEQALQMAELEVEAVSSLLPLLKTRRNGCTKVARLPNEILAHVIALLAGEDPPDTRFTLGTENRDAA